MHLVAVVQFARQVDRVQVGDFQRAAGCRHGVLHAAAIVQAVGARLGHRAANIDQDRSRRGRGLQFDRLAARRTGQQQDQGGTGQAGQYPEGDHGVRIESGGFFLSHD